MDNVEKLEKLANLKKKGIITAKEFQEQKEALLSKHKYGNKSQLCYVLLAFFFGTLGIHNFYAGRWKRGLVQLLLTLLTVFVGSVITGLWAIINIFRIHTDGKGNEFQPCRVAKIICGVLGILGYLWIVIGVFTVGGIAGYTMAMNKYKANEILAAGSQCVILSQSVNEGIGIYDGQLIDCKKDYDLDVMPNITLKVSKYNGNYTLYVEGVNENIKKIMYDTFPLNGNPFYLTIK